MKWLAIAAVALWIGWMIGSSLEPSPGLEKFLVAVFVGCCSLMWWIWSAKMHRKW